MKHHLTFLSTLLASTFLAAHVAGACSSTEVQGADGGCYPSSGSCGDNCSYHYDGNTLYIDGPADKTQTGKIQDNAFYKGKSSSYKSIIPTTVTDVVISGNITDIGDSAFSWAKVQNLELPDSLKTIGKSALAGMKSVTQLSLPDSLISIGDYAFEKMTGVTGELVIPDSVTSIGFAALDGMTGVTELTIGNSITSVGYGAFANMTGITELTIPDSVTSLGDYPFIYTTNLQSLTLGKNLENAPFLSLEDLPSLTELNIPDTIEGFDLTYLINDSDFLNAASWYEGAQKDYEEFLEYGISEEEAREWSRIDQYKQELDAAAEALRNKGASLTINCIGNADVCKQNILNALPQTHKDALGDYDPFIFAGASYKQKNPDGSVAYYTGDGKLKTIRGKKIYTVQEAEEVTKNGDKFHVYLTYK